MIHIDKITEYPATMLNARMRRLGPRWCHMWPDDPNDFDQLFELHELAAKMGMKEEWFQDKKGFPHYDLVPSKRIMAIRLGAKESNLREWLKKRMNEKGGWR